MAANVDVLAAVAAIPAGRQRQDFDRTRANLVNFGGFSQVNGGTTDKLLLSQLSILCDPILCAESEHAQLTEYVKQFNRANSGFGEGINSQQEIFITSYAHLWRRYRQLGLPMDQTSVSSYINQLTLDMVIKSRQDLQEMLDLKQQEAGTVAKLQIGTMFTGWLIGLRTLLSGLVGAYYYPIVYLSVPTTINPAHPLHDLWNRIPRVGPAYIRDNRWLFRLLEPAITGTHYAHFITQFATAQDGRGLLLAIMGMEGSNGNTVNQLKILKKVLGKVYTGKNTGLPFLKWYGELVTCYQAMETAGETTLQSTMVQDAWANIQIDGHPRLEALLASVRTSYPNDFHGFMTNSYSHIAYSGLEDGAGATTPRHRKVAEISNLNR